METRFLRRLTAQEPGSGGKPLGEKGKINNFVAVGIIALTVLVLGYFVWTRSAPPEPHPLPGQTLANPFGNDDIGAKGRLSGKSGPQVAPGK
ncbi:MAG TPA: hypothetical protein VFB21_20280 [Chthonomonadaceae bacterium]|nr:hypothetical protein [Chthonomonadaceae bacterium]